MGLLSNRIKREDLEPGDHIYSWRFAYSYAHHGIYVGDGSVIHFTRGQGRETGTGTCLDKIITSSSSLSKASASCTRGCDGDLGGNGVVQTCLECFLHGYPLYRFEYNENVFTFLAKTRGGMCSLAISDPSDIVLHRSQYLLANGFGDYHIFHNNCEDFAVYCKTGLLVLDSKHVGRSGQAVSFLGMPVATILSSPLRFFAAEVWSTLMITTAMYCLSRYAADVGVRKDVAKVPVEELVHILRPLRATQQADVEIDNVEESEVEQEACLAR
ncbi:hypothetical protein KP509_03G068300 [Ceratopteris richardii]|uniref:LRAT domain-containing protein n=1 Tax=Ceratopteris richardii TaxID=49495 RepID=A0A8T2V3S4_CERRI|nr:hypothetical protein KP509_03G068300 [Ceratopteris richardii]